MRRVWRLGQTQPVKVLFTAYQGTLEEQALRLMGLKMKAAQLLYGDEVGGAIVPETNENFLTELARSILQEQELPDLKALFAASQAQVMTNSPLGSAATPSPRLGLSQSQIAALYEQLLAEKQAKAKAKASRKEQQGQLRLPNGTTAVVQQMSMF